MFCRTAGVDEQQAASDGCQDKERQEGDRKERRSDAFPGVNGMKCPQFLLFKRVSVFKLNNVTIRKLLKHGIQSVAEEPGLGQCHLPWEGGPQWVRQKGKMTAFAQPITGGSEEAEGSPLGAPKGSHQPAVSTGDSQVGPSGKRDGIKSPQTHLARLQGPDLSRFLSWD